MRVGIERTPIVSVDEEKIGRRALSGTGEKLESGR